MNELCKADFIICRNRSFARSNGIWTSDATAGIDGGGKQKVNGENTDEYEDFGDKLEVTGFLHLTLLDAAEDQEVIIKTKWDGEEWKENKETVTALVNIHGLTCNRKG